MDKDSIKQQLKDAVYNKYKENIPLAYRMFVKDIIGSKTPFTESDLSPNEKAILRQLAANSLFRNSSEGKAFFNQWQTDDPNNPLYDKNKTGIQFIDYQDGGNLSNGQYNVREMTERINSNPEYAVRMGIGRANINRNPATGNVLLTDVYDFVPKNTGGIYQKLHDWGRNSGGYDVNINLGQMLSEPKPQYRYNPDTYYQQVLDRYENQGGIE